MRPIREGLAAAVLAAAVAVTGAAEGPKKAPPLAVPGLQRDQPITVTSHTLEFDYAANVVVYRGDVRAVQGDVTLTSDTLTIRLLKADERTGGAPDANGGATANPLGGRVQLREIIAAGRVRIDQGERWATGGRATFDQVARILVLSEDPVLHDGPNQIAGDRVVVFLDENRSVVEGGEKRVKAVLFPERDRARPRRERP